MITQQEDKMGVYYLIKHSASIDNTEIEDTFAQLLTMHKRGTQLRILEDSTNTPIHLGMGDLDKVKEGMSHFSKQFSQIKHAVYTDNTKGVAMAMFMEEHQVSPNYLFRVFSTTQSALKWLRE